MKKIMALGLAVVFMVSMVLPGCGKSAGTGQEEAGKGGKVKIRFASWDSAEDLEDQQKLVDAFNEQHDDIEVVLEAYGSDFDTKIAAGMGSGDAPDVMYMWNYPDYYEGLEPLDDYLAKEGEDFKADFYETLWNYNSMDGKIYGIPVGFTTHCLFYNKDLFDQAGVAYPTSDWTWDDLEAAAKQIHEKLGIYGFSYGIKADAYDYEMYLWSNNTSYVGKDGKMDGYLNSPESVATFTMFQDMQKDGYALAGEKGGRNEFSAQKSAMFIYGAWSINAFNEAGLNYGVVEIPAFAGSGHDSVSNLSTSGLAMSKDSKNKEAAWEFIKYWTGVELNKKRLGYEMSPHKSVVESEKIMEDPVYAPFYKMLEQSVGYTPTIFLTDKWSYISDELSLSFEEIFNPNTLEDPQTVLDAVVAEQ